MAKQIINSTPKQDGFYMPGEFAPQERVWMIWPERRDNWRDNAEPAQKAYAEKFYFAPGNTGFHVWDTAYAKIGVGICWDQWFPEAARCMALLGAELLLYPTAIGSEPTLQIDSKPHWQHTLQGHAAANLMPLIASNRIGEEQQDDSRIDFYGSSFIADETGEIVAEADRSSEAVLVHTFDLDDIAVRRRQWGIFRDRRSELYRSLI